MTRLFNAMSPAERKLRAIGAGNWLHPDLQIDIDKLPLDMRDRLKDVIFHTMPAIIQTPTDKLAQELPIAYDGDVISSTYHNALRKAILELAGNTGGGGTREPVVTLTIAPTFSPTYTPNGRTPEWLTQPGYVTNPVPPAGQRGGCDGWMQVKLPHGYQVDSMTVVGKRISGTTFGGNGFQVMLQKQALNTTDTPPLYSLSIPDSAGDPFSLPAIRQAAGDDLIVREETFKYLVRASVTGADSTAELRLYAVQIKCVTP